MLLPEQGDEHLALFAMYQEDSIVRNGVVILSHQADRFWDQEDETEFTNY